MRSWARAPKALPVAVRPFTERGMNVGLGQEQGLDRERVGAFTVVCGDADEAEKGSPS